MSLAARRPNGDVLNGTVRRSYGAGVQDVVANVASRRPNNCKVEDVASIAARRTHDDGV